MESIVRREWVYERLLCEFDHWDACITGLVQKNGELWWCQLEDDDMENNYRNSTYRIAPVEWTAECIEYLQDYRKAYPHWFRVEKASRPHNIKWFSEKWKKRNPIKEQVRWSRNELTA